MKAWPASLPIPRDSVACPVGFNGEPLALPGGYGTRAELLMRLESCLTFARQTVESANQNHPLWRVDLGQVSGYEKMMMEVGLLAHLVSRTGLCEEAVSRLASAIRANYDSSSALSCILRHPRLAASLGTLLLVLERFGLATQQESVLVHAALESPYLDCSEHVPFRLLDRRWVLGLARGAVEPLDEALRLSAACRTTHPIYMTREDGYAVTHAIMYATDFGAYTVPLELRDHALWGTIDAAVAWCTAAADYDLLSELLLAQLLLRRRLSAYGAIAWRVSRETWDAFGFLPSPSLSAGAFESLNDEGEQRQYAFHNMYHTVLVGGLLCAAFLGMRVTDPEVATDEAVYYQPPSVAHAIEGAVDHLQHVLGVSPVTAREVINAVEWTTDAEHLDELARAWAEGEGATAVATRMAIDASIILAAQEYDLPRLAAALRSAARTYSTTLTVQAGADFLARQSLVGGAIGAGLLDHPSSLLSRDPVASARATAALANCLVDLSDRLTRNLTSVR
jgi:hypothetical protein